MRVKKCVPTDLFQKEKISPVTLARWFMDDGGVAILTVFNFIRRALQNKK